MRSGTAESTRAGYDVTREQYQLTFSKELCCMNAISCKSHLKFDENGCTANRNHDEEEISDYLQVRKLKLEEVYMQLRS